MKANFTTAKWLVILLLFATKFSWAQLGKPEVENVYGGRINYITGYPYKVDTTRIFISTESANSMFYADVATPAVGAASFGAFHKLKSADATKNFGGGIRYFQVHQTSGTVYFSGPDKLYKTTATATSVTDVATGNMLVPFIYGNTLMYASGGQLNFGTLDASGNFTAGVGSPISMPPTMGMPMFAADPVNNSVYVFYAGTGSTIKLYKSSNAYNAFTSATTFSDITPTTLSATYDYRAMNIAPDGRLFIAGANTSGPISKRMEYTDDDLAWTSVNTGIDGVGGEVIAFGGTSANYHVYYTKSASNNKGAAGSWITFGQTGFETHPNDGAVYADVNDTNIVYMTTDQGIGASVNEGYTIFEIDNGVEAVQVMDFDMTSDKKTAWLASKAGIRKVSNYTTTPTWTDAKFPNGDGSPYYSAEMAGDTNKVYVGNSRVYRTFNGGTNWTQVFTPESAPYNWTGAIVCEAIEVCQFDTSIVFAGYQLQGTEKGGLFYSRNGGNSWSQIKLDVASTPNHDVDVHDIVFTKEGTDTVAYVGVDYDLSAPTGRSVYRVLKSGATWTATQDMNAGTTSTGSLIVASIRDLHTNAATDTVFASGTDAGINHPIAYYKPINSTNKWTPFTTSGFPFITGKQGYAITLGHDTVYVAVDNEVYNYALGGASWKLGFTYPVGTQINVLFFDDLLVGTGTGLYGHRGLGGNSNINVNALKNEIVLYPNPSKDIINIKLPIDFKIEKIIISDLVGRKIMSFNSDKISVNNNVTSISLKEIPNGVYMINVIGGGKEFSKKIKIE
jgi:hypothetical protein